MGSESLMSLHSTQPSFTASVEHRDAASPILLVCEHASNAFPDPWGGLGLTDAQRSDHIAWDPGALDLSRALSARLDATLVHAPVSRLIYDLNRGPDRPDAMAARSEVHDIPGNHALTPESRLHRTEALYLPFHNTLHGEIARRLALGRATVIVTIHSFTPVYHGQARAVEFGVIHDADDRLSRAIVADAQAKTDLGCALNKPYSAADGVTHTLRLHATPYGLLNAMLEIRNDLIATPEQVAVMADSLAPVLQRALLAVAEG
ncbi:MAG: N-formylglutamate amidohydrolase [Pseudotabrizicola sp.]|uniref:N-formylglutamate amidohydrolase n=1 Tax=Pseudotabrizicola sp. TaxID=2939647 RepID=UPI00273139A9|nr:N-formylglutamate amidohydrolase [Pseudotabrizicola sp.]MDP2082544.1 N-formylglutamate amidohydrolase [Pseudotabrizicola sp.]MDZ7573945.1 N-formylglutamate amidohydrolase [Pseudotabrizicola sp.]